MFGLVIIEITSQGDENSGNWDETLPILSTVTTHLGVSDQHRCLVELKSSVKIPRGTVFDILSLERLSAIVMKYVEPFVCKPQVITFTPCCFNLIQPEERL